MIIRTSGRDKNVKKKGRKKKRKKKNCDYLSEYRHPDFAITNPVPSQCAIAASIHKDVKNIIFKHTISHDKHYSKPLNEGRGDQRGVRGKFDWNFCCCLVFKRLYFLTKWFVLLVLRLKMDVWRRSRVFLSSFLPRNPTFLCSACRWTFTPGIKVILIFALQQIASFKKVHRWAFTYTKYI